MDAHRSFLTGVGLALTAGLLALSGCSSDRTDAAASDTSSSETSSTSEEPTTTTASTEVPVPGGLVGIGCSGYAVKVPMGPGSLDGMVTDTAGVAISNSPLLTTFASALSGKLNSEVNLFDTVNSGQYTVFAPVDEAWGRLAPETVEKLKSDSALLTKILSYHLVQGELAPDQVVGEHKTVQGATVNVTGGGEDLKVNDAVVVCGGIKTSNAVVYLVDTVLTPPPPGPPKNSSGAPTESGDPTTSGTSDATTTATTTTSSAATDTTSGTTTSGTTTSTTPTSTTPTS